MSGIHGQQTPDQGIHVPFNWTYNNATEREAATGLFPQDVGKLAFQLDNFSLWILVDEDPVTWVPIGAIQGAENLGTGAEVFKDILNQNLRFRTLAEGSNITITEGTNEITFDGPTPGEVNTASNAGAGAGVFKVKNVFDLVFKSLTAGTNIVITPSADTIEIKGTTQFELPIRVFFVANNFSGILPFFNNIQAAIDAATDTANFEYFIYIWPGIYNPTVGTVPVATLKHNVFLIGTDPDRTVIQNNSTFSVNAVELIVNAGSPSGTQKTGLFNLTVLRAAASGGGSPLYVESGSGQSAKPISMVVKNCKIQGSLTNRVGFVWTNNSGATTHSMVVESCTIIQGGAGPAIQMGANQPITGTEFRRCRITGDIQLSSSTTTIVFSHCEITGTPIGNGQGTYRFENCILGAINNSGNFTALPSVECQSCSIGSINLSSVHASPTSVVLMNCSLRTVTGDTNLVTIGNATQITLRMFGCIIENGKINFTANNTLCRFVDVIVRNPSGSSSIAGTATVFLGNFTSDKSLAGGISQVGGSFNVNVGVAI